MCQCIWSACHSVNTTEMCANKHAYNHTHICIYACRYLYIIFFVIVGSYRGLCLLGKHTITWATIPVLFVYYHAGTGPCIFSMLFLMCLFIVCPWAITLPQWIWKRTEFLPKQAASIKSGIFFSYLSISPWMTKLRVTCAFTDSGDWEWHLAAIFNNEKPMRPLPSPPVMVQMQTTGIKEIAVLMSSFVATCPGWVTWLRV
jgi:hypothetical protein